MENTSKIFAQNVKLIRENLKMSRSAFAKLVGISDRAVAYIEGGQERVFFETIDKMSMALKFPPSIFFMKTPIVGVDPKISLINELLQNLPSDRVDLVYDLTVKVTAIE